MYVGYTNSFSILFFVLLNSYVCRWSKIFAMWIFCLHVLTWGPVNRYGFFDTQAYDVASGVTTSGLILPTWCYVPSELYKTPHHPLTYQFLFYILPESWAWLLLSRWIAMMRLFWFFVAWVFYWKKSDLNCTNSDVPYARKYVWVSICYKVPVHHRCTSF